MDKRKALIKEYKQQPLHGGVYTIRNTQNGKYLIEHAANLRSAQNRFQFAVTTGATIHPKMRKDWETLGAQSFIFEVLAELEQQPEQSQVEFMDDLQELENLLRADLDAATEY
jgi:hypothetical protein